MAVWLQLCERFFSSDVCPWPLGCICDALVFGGALFPSFLLGVHSTRHTAVQTPRPQGLHLRMEAPCWAVLPGASPLSSGWLLASLLGDSVSLEVLPSHFPRWRREGLSRVRPRSNENPFTLLLASASSRIKNYCNRAHSYGNYCDKKLETHNKSSLLEGPISKV